MLVDLDTKIVMLCVSSKMSELHKDREKKGVLFHINTKYTLYGSFFPHSLALNILFLVFILEEFRKKQKKSNMSDNLQYFMETSCKATGSDTSKVKIITTHLLQHFC